MFDVSSEEITEGPLGRALAFLAIPIVVQELALVAQSIIDVFWLGRLSGEAVAAVGLVQPVLGLLIAAALAVYVGEQVIVSQRVGDGDVAGARRAAFHGFVTVGAVMAVLALATYAVAPTITRLFRPGEEVATLATAYLGAMAFAFVANALSDSVEAAFVGAGDSRTPLAANLLAIGTNAVLDPFLIFGWWRFDAYGIAGAAYATLVGYALGLTLILAVALSSRGGFSFDREAVGFDVGELRELVAIGAPRAGQTVARQVARLLMVAMISLTGGAAALAAYTIGARIATVAFIPAAGIGSASTTLVGQNLGASRPDRATRATWLGVVVGAIGVGLLGIGQWVFPVAIARVFVPDIGGATLTYSVAYLQILAYGYWALGAIYTVEAGFNGAGKTTVSMYSTMLQYWAVRVPIAAVGAFLLGYGALGPFWAVTISNVVAAVGLCGYFRYSTGSGMLERAAEATSGGEPAG